MHLQLLSLLQPFLPQSSSFLLSACYSSRLAATSDWLQKEKEKKIIKCPPNTPCPGAKCTISEGALFLQHVTRTISPADILPDLTDLIIANTQVIISPLIFVSLSDISQNIVTCDFLLLVFLLTFHFVSFFFLVIR